MKKVNLVFLSLAALALGLLVSCSGHRETVQSDNVAPPQVRSGKKDYRKPTDPALLAGLEKLSAELEAKRKELHIPGMAIAVVKDDAIVFARGFGVSDVEKQTPVTTETIFAIGSTTKAFTTALVGMMVEEDKMDWDDPVTNYLPELKFPVDGKADDERVTIRDMLCHRTGFARMGLLWANGKTGREEILADSVKAEPYASFREKFYYNNVMYMAAGVAAGKAAGSDWDQLLEERIFLPLGMRDATTSFETVQRNPRLSKGYIWDEHEEDFVRMPMRNLANIGPAGSINANVLDMAQWIRFQLGKGAYSGRRLMAEEHLLETWKPQIAITDDVDYGLGWMLQTWNGQAVMQHGGNIDGFGAMVALLPDSNMGFVLLTNVTATPLQQMSVNMVWDHLAGEGAEPEPAVAEAGTEAETDFEPYLGEYIANFATFREATITVLEKNGKLAVDVPGQMAYELKPPNEEGKWYFALTDTISVMFENKKDGKYNMLRMQQGGANFEIPRKGVPIEPEIEESALLKYTGTYRSERLGNIKVLIQNGRLALDVPGQMVFELHLPDEEGKRRFRIIDRAAVRFDEDDDGRVVSMTSFEGQNAPRTLPRVEAEEDRVPTLAEIHALRKTEQRAAALAEMGGYRIDGTVSFPQAGVTGKTVIFGDGLARYSLKHDFGKYGHTETVVTPEKGATNSSFSPYLSLGGKMLEQGRKSHPLLLFSDWSELYTEVKVLGNRKLNDKQTHLLSLKGGDTMASILYLDPETGDVLKQETTAYLAGMGELPVVNHFEDFREVNGLRIPFRTISENEQNGKTVIQYEKLEAGVKLKRKQFAVKKPK
ncbi:MAG: serine hydrolase [Acidobacteriota bacterium]|nr:serine hydrolase [Acidobacteriota bacterium]